jgi:hypothetical protein
MATFSKLRGVFRRQQTDDQTSEPDISIALSTGLEENKTMHVTGDATAVSNDNKETDLEVPSEEVQRGVQDVEAVTLSWSKGALIAVFLK